jgi:hypothetical protein
MPPQKAIGAEQNDHADPSARFEPEGACFIARYPVRVTSPRHGVQRHAAAARESSLPQGAINSRHLESLGGVSNLGIPLRCSLNRHLPMRPANMQAIRAASRHSHGRLRGIRSVALWQNIPRPWRSPMSLRFYHGSGSPYARKVWLALEHKTIPYEFRVRPRRHQGARVPRRQPPRSGAGHPG